MHTGDAIDIASLSHATANGWSEEGWAMNHGEPDSSGVGGKLAACMWPCAKAVTSNGQRNMECFRNQMRNSVIDAVNRSRRKEKPNPGWVSEFPVMMHGHDILERLMFDIDVPCVVQWRFPSFSVPTTANAHLVHEGTNAGDVQSGCVRCTGIRFQV